MVSPLTLYPPPCSGFSLAPLTYCSRACQRFSWFSLSRAEGEFLETSPCLLWSPRGTRKPLFAEWTLEPYFSSSSPRKHRHSLTWAFTLKEKVSGPAHSGVSPRPFYVP